MAEASPPPPLSPRHWPAWIGIGTMALLARLPWRLQRALGRALGALLHAVLGERRRIAARNLELCFPRLDMPAREHLLRAHFAALGIGVFEFARAWWGSVAPLRRGIEVEGLEHMQAARVDGRGVIGVSGHFTTREVCGRLMCDHVPLAGMYRPHAQPAMEWAVRRGRARYAAAMFPKQDVRGAVRHLKRGGLLWYAPDQDPSRGDAVYVPFFGQPAHSLTSTHALARMSGAVASHAAGMDSTSTSPGCSTTCGACTGGTAGGAAGTAAANTHAWQSAPKPSPELAPRRFS